MGWIIIKEVKTFLFRGDDIPVSTAMTIFMGTKSYKGSFCVPIFYCSVHMFQTFSKKGLDIDNLGKSGFF